jgi:hypothetical protein
MKVSLIKTALITGMPDPQSVHPQKCAAIPRAEQMNASGGRIQMTDTAAAITHEKKTNKTIVWKGDLEQNNDRASLLVDLPFPITIIIFYTHLLIHNRNCFRGDGVSAIKTYAVYKDGMLVLEDPVNLKEHTRVEVVIRKKFSEF